MKKKRLNFSGRRIPCLKQICRIMKLTTFFLFVMLVHVSAGVFSQTNGRLSLKADQESISEILKQIEDETNYTFMYNRNNIDVERKININCQGENIEKVLDILFQGTNVKYRSFNNNYVLYLEEDLPTVLSQQPKSVSGTVKDQDGQPVPGVTVVIKGTTRGTITGVDGKYSFTGLPGNAVLVFSFVGMQQQEVPVNSSTVNVVLKNETIGLDEVVAIGYGTAKKRDLTGSVSSVKGETLAQIPVASTAQALTGRLAGVQITTADGSPDAEMIIRVRGGGSITGDNSPLYIVDGFPVSSISDVSPTDIESIDVLKDASSTAIYGSQGANGVVIITTKSAKGGKTQVSYNSFMQSKTLAQKMKVMDTYEYVMTNYELAALGGDDDIESFTERFGVYDDLELYKYIKGTDWQKDMFGSNVISQQQNISINGGNEKTKFLLSGTYNKDGGLMENNDYRRYNFNFKLNHKLSDKLTFNLNARVSDVLIHGSGTSGGTYKVRTSDALVNGPTNGLSDYTEVDPTLLTEEEYDEWVRANLTLSEQAAQYWRRQYRKTFNFTSSIDWEIIKGLKYRLEGGYQYGFNEVQNYWGEYTSQASYVNGEPLIDWRKTNLRNVREAQTLTYNFNINKDHQFNVMVGQETVSDQSDDNYIYATGYSSDLSAEKIFANIALADGNISVTSNEDADDNLASFFGRLGYNYKDKYLLSATFRADGSSKFPKKNHWGYFPSAALAWRLTEEPFMKPFSNWLSNLKLRISYGEAGNNRIADALYKAEYSLSTTKAYGVDDNLSSYYATANEELANPNLKWETTTTRNIGLDFGFFDERLSGTLEVYKNTSSDLLIERDIVAPGYESTIENVGATSNKGMELTLNAFLINKRDFSLSANFNISFNRSNVDKLAEGITEQSYASGWAGTDNKGYYDYKVMVGKPVGLMYGWVVDGYYTTDDFSEYDAANEEYVLKDGVPTTGLLGGRIGVRPGTIKLKDFDDSGTIDENDRRVIGDANPDFTGGFGLNATFHGFDASVLFSFVYGNDIYNATKIAASQQYRTSYPNMLNIMNADNRYTYLNRETGELVTDLETLKEMNEGKNAKKYWSPFSFGNAVVLPTSWAIEDGSFLRLQNVTLGYTLPSRLTRRFLCNQFRLYCTLDNVWLLTNYSGYDPEVSSPVRGSSTSGLTPGVDYSSYPKSFSWTLGLNVTF